MTRFLRNHASSLVVVRRPRLSLSVAPKCIGRYQTRIRHSRIPESAQRPRSSGSPLLPLLPHTRRSPTSTTLKENNVTTISPSAPGRIMGPPSVKGAVTTSNTHSKKRNLPTHTPLLLNRFEVRIEVAVLTKGGGASGKRGSRRGFLLMGGLVCTSNNMQTGLYCRVSPPDSTCPSLATWGGTLTPRVRARV